MTIRGLVLLSTAVMTAVMCWLMGVWLSIGEFPPDSVLVLWLGQAVLVALFVPLNGAAVLLVDQLYRLTVLFLLPLPLYTVLYLSASVSSERLIQLMVYGMGFGLLVLGSSYALQRRYAFRDSLPVLVATLQVFMLLLGLRLALLLAA